MAIRAQDTQPVEIRQSEFQAVVREAMREFVRRALTAVLEEGTALLGATPYEGTPFRRIRRPT